MTRSRAVLMAALLAATLGCDRKQASGPPPAPPAPPVQVAPVVQQDTPVYLDAIGRCVSPDVVAVRPQVSGPITEIHFADGAEVKKGDPLFTIDKRPFDIQLSAANANHAEATAAHDLAKSDFERAETLVKERAVSQQEHDRARNAVSVAAARISQTVSAIDAAQLNLEYCTVRAPVDGRVGHRLRDAGNIVTANETQLLVIERLDPLYADFTVPERHLLSIRANLGSDGDLPVEVRIPDAAGEPMTGRLTFIDNAIDQTTGTVRLRATIPNPERRLWPGLFIRVRLILKTLKGALLVPAAAPQASPRGTIVYVVPENNAADMRPVKLGQRHGPLIVVEEGVKAGERVIVAGHMGVQPGRPVRIVEKAP